MGDTLAGVSCTSATSCMAAGTGPALEHTKGGILAESWNGTAWKVVTAPEGPTS